MEQNSFCGILASLRKQKGISQRQAAADLLISQALLSHYETGAREPGLPFLCRACDYYGVTADYLLGRSPRASQPPLRPEEIRALADRMRQTADRLEAFAQ